MHHRADRRCLRPDPVDQRGGALLGLGDHPLGRPVLGFNETISKVARDEVAHAWAFLGPAGVGQQTAARWLAAAVNELA